MGILALLAEKHSTVRYILTLRIRHFHLENGLPRRVELKGNCADTKPAFRRSIAARFCSSSREGGRPKHLSLAFALAIPKCMRSSTQSSSNSATAKLPA
jgi:hypothetical protein